MDEDSLSTLLAGHQVATAESCTAGLVAQALAQLPDASEWFRGGSSRTSETKFRHLGVSPGPSSPCPPRSRWPVAPNSFRRRRRDLRDRRGGTRPTRRRRARDPHHRCRGGRHRHRDDAPLRRPARGGLRPRPSAALESLAAALTQHQAVGGSRWVSVLARGYRRAGHVVRTRGGSNGRHREGRLGRRGSA